MSTGAIITIVIIIGLFIAAIFVGLSMNKKLVASGEIINRGTKFMEKAEIFTLNEPDPAEVSICVKSYTVYQKGVSMRGSTEDQIYSFKGSSWEAVLKETGVSDGKSVYRFEFTSWKTRDGMAQDSLNMNRLLTSVEKMFASFDPSTIVRTEAVDFKIKSSIF